MRRIGDRVIRGLGFVVMMALLLQVSSFAMDKNVSDLIAKIRDGQNKIKDMSADIITDIKSDVKGQKAMSQKGSIYVKGTDKVRIEMKSPVDEVTVTNKDKVMVVNNATGQKMVQDINKLRKQKGRSDLGQSPLDQTKALEAFNLKLEQSGENYIVTGTPKQANPFIGSIKFYVDGEKYLPTKVEIYTDKGKIFSSSTMEYAKIKDIYVLQKNIADVSLPNGKMQVIVKFDNLKVNEGVNDKLFDIK